MSGPEQVAEVARGLTKAQRAAMLRPPWTRGGTTLCMPGNVDRRVKWALCCAKLLRDYIGAPAFTPLGLAVRAHLQSAGAA